MKEEYSSRLIFKKLTYQKGDHAQEDPYKTKVEK
jgi:hypothetical protein